MQPACRLRWTVVAARKLGLKCNMGLKIPICEESVAERMVEACESLRMSADRVTFTVQKGVKIECGNPARAANIENQWISEFQRNLSEREKREGGSEIQALYHSSALPLPYSNQSLERIIKSNGIGISGGPGPLSGLVSACLVAFTEHKRLVLRPDDIFLPLLDAAATHVFQSGEESRNVFVAHEGKKRLTVVRNDFAPPGSAPNVNDWAGTLPEFRTQLIAKVRAGSVDAALPEFSTSDAITSAAFTCSLMRALQNFFQYHCMTLCGIPEVTLLGTVADWIDLHARFLVLADTWMHRSPETCDWVKDVDSFLKQFIAARSGQVDEGWWVSLFTYHGARGSGSSPYVTGHINVLFPWYRSTGEKFGWIGTEKAKRNFPDGMNCVPMMWTYLGKDIPMKAWAGSMCTCISEDGGEVAPAVCVGFTIDKPGGDPDLEDNEF